MASTTKQMQVQAGNAQATVNATVSDGMPAVPCPDPAGYRYVGARYVPKFADPIEWNSRNTYEPLTVVVHEGNSYTSKSYVPAGIDIANDTYWVATGNYNGQFQHLINQVDKYLTDIDANTEAIAKETAERTAADDKFEDQITGLMASVGGLSSDPPVFVSTTGEMTDITKVYVLTTNGHVYAYNGSSFVDTGVDYGVANAVHYDRIISPPTAEAPYDDANTLPLNTVCLIGGGDTMIANMPSNEGGSVLTYGGANWKTQIYIEAGGSRRLMYRYFKEGGAGTEWIPLLQGDNITDIIEDTVDAMPNIIKYDYIISPPTAEAPYDDANTLPLNTVCLIGGGDTMIANMPSNEGGSVLTYGGANWKTQIYIEAGGSRRLMYRYFKEGGAGTEWIPLLQGDNITDIIEDTVDMSYGSVSLFKTIGVIGDSYASGWNQEDDRNLDISWPQIMGRKYGVNVENFTRSGATFKSWLTDEEYGLAALQSADAKQLYLVAMGINEQWQSFPIGTSADMTDNPVNNPDTFYGNADKVIYYVKQKAPNAKIIIIGLAVASTDYNTALMNVANHNGIPFINTQNDVYFTSDYYTGNKVAGHPVSVTYSGMADAYARLVAETFNTNSSYYADYKGE